MLQNRQGSAITEIIRVVSRADTGDQILSSSLERSKEILTFDKGAMFSINLETRQAELKAQIGIFGDPLPSFLSSDHRIDVRRPPYDPVPSTPVPVFYEEVPREEAGEMMTFLTSVGIRSLAVIPLTAGSAVLGVFYAGWTSSHPFGDEEKEILTMMGQEVGNALFKVVLQDKLVAAMTRAEINHERAEQARDEANFYLDIMTHDINNVNQTALGYIVLLSEPGGESPEELLKKLERSITKSSDIIRQVSIIRRIRDTEPRLHGVNLDAVIRDAILHYADARIGYTGCLLNVYADELMPEIFMNLFGNAIKFGGPDTSITVEVRPQAKRVEITIRDTGPGIPDALKPLLFQKYQRGATEMSGKGLGLYIVRMLVERYGGQVWVEDAVPGYPDQGAAVIFTLMRAGPNPVQGQGTGS